MNHMYTLASRKSFYNHTPLPTTITATTPKYNAVILGPEFRQVAQVN